MRLSFSFYSAASHHHVAFILFYSAASYHVAFIIFFTVNVTPCDLHSFLQCSVTLCGLHSFLQCSVTTLLPFFFLQCSVTLRGLHSFVCKKDLYRTINISYTVGSCVSRKTFLTTKFCGSKIYLLRIQMKHFANPNPDTA